MRRMLVALVFLFAIALTASCGEGDFDQQIRGDIDEIRDNASIRINTNPGAGDGQIEGFAWTDGPVGNARVEIFGVGDDGVIRDGPGEALGNSLTAFFDGAFQVTLRQAYAGPLIVKIRPNTIGGVDATYTNAATARSEPRPILEVGDELLGFVPDFPNAKDSLIVSQFTTIAVERAIALGGISSGNLSLASYQVGQFFGLITSRWSSPFNLTIEGLDDGRVNQDLTFAAISQLAFEAGVDSPKVWLGMREDVRDDGLLNGTSGLIPGSGLALPNLGSPDYIGDRLLGDGFLDPANDENLTRYERDNASAFQLDHIDLLNARRSLDDYPIEIEEGSLAEDVIYLKPGQVDGVGVRGFTRVENRVFQVASTDGPSVALFDVTPDDPSIVSLDGNGRLVADPAATPGQRTTVNVRLRPDGFYLVGAYDETFTLTVIIVP